MLGDRTRVLGMVGRARRTPESRLSVACQAWWKCNDGSGDTIADASPNARHISKGASPVAAATVWANKGRATFPGNALGWSRSGSGLFGAFSNVAGGSLLWMFRINAASAPLSIDRMFLGAPAVTGYDTVHARLRPVGTAFNTGDDGTVAFGTYPNGGSVSVVQVTTPVAQAQRSVCVGRDRHVAVLTRAADKTMSFWYDGVLMLTATQTAPQQAVALNAAPTFYFGNALSQAGNTESIQLFDAQIYASASPAPSDLADSIARIALRPYTFLTDEDWP